MYVTCHVPHAIDTKKLKTSALFRAAVSVSNMTSSPAASSSGRVRRWSAALSSPPQTRSILAPPVSPPPVSPPPASPPRWLSSPSERIGMPSFAVPTSRPRSAEGAAADDVDWQPPGDWQPPIAVNPHTPHPHHAVFETSRSRSRHDGGSPRGEESYALGGWPISSRKMTSPPLQI